MKAFVFIIAVGFAAASNWHSAYQSESEYVYRYDSQVLSGVPHHGIQYSGVKISATVKLQLRAGSQATLQLQDVKICKIQTELSSPFVETEMLPESMCSPVEASLFQDMNQELSQPIKFIYIQGQISDLKMDPQEPLWSKNFKKGILSTFKVNLEGAKRPEDEIVGDWQMQRDSVLNFNSYWQVNDEWQVNEQLMRGDYEGFNPGFSLPSQYQDFFSKYNTDQVHTTMESDVCGVCKTVYGVMNAERGILGDSNKLRVTKVKDFNNCALAPRHQQGLISGLTIVQPEYSEKDLVEKSSQTDYEIIGTPQAFLIEKVQQLSSYTVQPMAKEHGSAVTTTIQQMTLISCQSIGAAIQPSVSLSRTSQGLLYEFSRSSMEKPSIFDIEELNMDLDFNVQIASPQQKLDKIDQLLKEALSLVYPEVREASIEKIKKIECLLKRLSAEEIIQVCERYLSMGGQGFGQGLDQVSDRRRKAEILLDIIPTLTQPKVVPVMVHLITKNLISDTRAAISFKLMALTVTPDLQAIQLLKPSGELGRHIRSERHSQLLKNAISINLGNIARRYITNSMNKGIPRSQIISQLENNAMSIQEIYSDIQAAQTTQEKVSKIRGVGNAGIASFIPLFAEIAKDKSETKIVRQSAMFSLKKMPRLAKQKVQNILLSVYMDRTEQPEIRMAAVVALIDNIPSEATLQLLVRVQRKETSVQVGSFVYSYLSSLARAQLPGLQRLSFNLRKVMPLIRAVMPDTFCTAKGLHFDYISKYNDIGIGLDVMKMNGPEDIVPSSFMSRLSLHAFGQTLEALQGGVYMRGVQPILSKLVGVHSGLLGSMRQKSLKEIVQAYLTPLQSGSIEFGDVADDIQTIISKLGIVKRPVLEKLNLGMYMKFFGNDICFLEVSADDIITWLQSGQSTIVERFQGYMRDWTLSQGQLDMLKVLNSGRSSLQIPTPVGLPLFVNASAVAVAQVNGQGSLTGATLKDIVSYGITGKLPSQISASAKINPSVVFRMKAKMGVRVGLISTGVSLKAEARNHLPFTLQASLNSQTGKLRVEFTLPTEGAQVLYAKITPQTFVLKESSGTCLDSQWSAQTLTHPTHRQMRNIQFQVPLGINTNQLDIEVNAPKTLPAYLPFAYLWSQKSINVQLEPTRRSVPTVVELWAATSQWSADWQDRSSTWLPEWVTINPLITKPNVIKAGISVGPQSNSKAQISAVFVRSPDCWLQQFNTHITVPSYFNQPMSANLFLNINAMTVRPSLMRSLSSETPVAKLSVSSPYRSRSNFIIRITPQPTQLLTSVYNSHKNVFLRLIEQVTGAEVITSNMNPIPDNTDTVTYKVKVEGQDINWNKAETIGVTLLTASSAYFGVPSVSTIDYKQVDSAPTNSFEGQLIISPKHKKGVLSLRTPSSKEYTMELPTYLYKPWHRISSVQRPILVHQQPQDVYLPPQFPFQDVAKGICSIQYSQEIGQQRVTTFDSLSYTFPALPQSCEVVLAKDCSSLNLFTVLMTPVQRTKFLKVLVPGYRILIKPETSWQSSTTYVNVQVNGQELSLSDSVEIPLRSQAAAVQGSDISGVIIKKGSWVTVRIPSVGLVVSTDGSRVIVKTGRLLRSHLCGLCGNFNDDSADEYEGPDMKMYSESKHMISRYVLSSDSCSLSAVREQYQIPENFFQRKCQTEQRTHVIQHMGKTCFSINPIQSCSSSCRGNDFTSASVAVHCRSADNRHTIRMMEESESLKIVPNMASRRQDEVISIDVPSTCVPNF